MESDDSWSVDEEECLIDRDLGVSGYGENPLTGEIDGEKRSSKLQKNRAGKGSFLHPIKDTIHKQICDFLNPQFSIPLNR